MKDARERHVKRPDDPATYIPRRCQTYAAPVSYALHNLLTPPSYDWSKIVGKDPIRFNCRDEALQVLAEPQLLEDVDFSKPLPSLPASVKTSLTFPVTTLSITNAQKGFERAFAEERQLQSLLLDEQGKRMDAAATRFDRSEAERPGHVAARLRRFRGALIVSRGRNGEAQKSHWQTVLQLMSDEPLAIEPGDSMCFDFEARPEKGSVTKATSGLRPGAL